MRVVGIVGLVAMVVVGNLFADVTAAALLKVRADLVVFPRVVM